MNRAIVDHVLTKGDQGYKSFKECLQKAEQGHIVSHLSEVENQLSQGKYSSLVGWEVT